MNRRRFIQGLGALLASGIALGCASDPKVATQPSSQPVSTKQVVAPTATLFYSVATPPNQPTRTAVRPSTTSPAPSGAKQLTILHTNDSRGYVDPCG